MPNKYEFVNGANLPIIRSGERACYKRCQKKWYWAWRRGLVPRAAQFGALEFGTWMHAAMAAWYGNGFKRNGELAKHFNTIAELAIGAARVNKAPDYVLDKAEELMVLGGQLAQGYQDHYQGDDPELYVLAREIPLEFSISSREGQIVAVHKLKPDLVAIQANTEDVWLIETKTAKTIRSAHLPIDDQARPYGSMSELALRKLGIIKPNHRFRGIKYNYLRKALADLRPKDDQGRSLNKDGSVSKKQPAPLFMRKEIVMSRRAKQIALTRVRNETLKITLLALELRQGLVSPNSLDKTSHYSCERCEFFQMCIAEEQGADIREMMRSLYIRRDPYKYEEETTEETVTFDD